MRIIILAATFSFCVTVVKIGLLICVGVFLYGFKNCMGIYIHFFHVMFYKARNAYCSMWVLVLGDTRFAWDEEVVMM